MEGWRGGPLMEKNPERVLIVKALNAKISEKLKTGEVY